MMKYKQFLHSAGDDDRDDEEAAAALEKVKGDLSTKMAAVVKTLGRTADSLAHSMTLRGIF